jgi:hypothetical protein
MKTAPFLAVTTALFKGTQQNHVIASYTMLNPTGNRSQFHLDRAIRAF